MSRKTRKLMWSVPLIAAVAVIGALALYMTLTPNSALAQAEEIPGMPMKPTAKALGPSSIELMWEAPTTGGTPDGYRIDYSDDGKVWYSLEPNHDSTVFTDDKDLMAVQKRYYRIFAFNSGGSSSVLSGISATTDKSMEADAPTNIVVAAGDGAEAPAMTQTQITLTWTAPEDPDGAPVKKYKIEVSKDGRSFSKLAEQTPMQAMCTGTGDSCTYTHKKLLEMQGRWYRVSATNYPNGMGASAVESAASVAKSAETEAGAIPAAPQNLRAGVNPAGRMWLYWDEPDTSAGGTPLPGAPVVGYYIYGDGIASGGTAENPSTGADVANMHFVEASTSLALTPSVLAKFGPLDADGADDDAATANDNEVYWEFSVMAVNSVVRRNLADGEWDTDDATWSAALAVDNRKDVVAGAPASDPDGDDVTDNDETDDLLNRPTLTAKRINNVNAGRTSIKLDWKIEKLASTDTTKVYRLERSEDRIDWRDLEITVTGETRTHTDELGDPVTATSHKVIAGTTYYYRVFAAHNKADLTNVYTEASLTTPVTTAPAGKPDAPQTPSATPASETQIDVAWTAPGIDGTEEVGHGKVINYEIDVSDDGKTWSLLTTVAGDKLAYEHKGLVQGQTKYYRVSTINNAPGSTRRSVPTDAVSATTLTSFASDSPGGLVAKAMGRTAIELLWNARAFDITAAPIIGYKIESSPLNAMGDCAEDWTVLVADTMITTTSYTHSGLAAETGRCYRVFGINIVATSSAFVGHGDQYVVTNDNDAKATTGPAVVPGMPTAVNASATSATEITVSWTAPSDTGGADITGYIIERRYTGDMMGAIPSDGYSGEDGANRSFAFSNAMEWWETLNCKGMLGAAGSSADPDMDSDDKSMYCAHFLNTEPSNVTDTSVELSDEAKAAVEALFAKRYVVLTGTDTSYMDTMLMPETKYTYRVSAVNAKGRSAWSTADMATTDRTNVAPVTGDAIDPQTVTAGKSVEVDVSGNFSDTDTGDMLTYTAMSSDMAVATVSVESSTVTIMGQMAGSADITVTATDTGNMAGKLSVSQTFTVTVESANTAPKAVGKIADVTVTAGGTRTSTMAVSTYFSDADADDTLTYSASSADDTVATATVNADGMIIVGGLKVGSTTVTVTATDLAGETASQEFTVTVVAANTAPTTVGTIGDITLTAGHTAEAMDVSGYFNDAGDTLTYNASSDDDTVATAAASGSMVTVTGVSAGSATITVTATDSGSLSATQTFMVTVEPVPLAAPTNVRVNPVGSGIVLVSWDSAAGATGYTLIAVSLINSEEFGTAVVNNPDSESGSIDGLVLGREYLIFVGSFNADLEYKLSSYVRVTVE
ncbi:MAG: fibronectin type III domain-containing protein [Chloroflexi bacterium]|nr:fibronectin type III domain-containing protein [Chloroflexota bacterium]